MRYTITVKNISNADAANVMLRDAVPANTIYVAGSTTLNGANSRGCRGRLAARERHADQLAGQCDSGFDACRRVEQPGQRRNHHLRCRRDLRPSLTARSSRTRAS